MISFLFVSLEKLAIRSSSALDFNISETVESSLIPVAVNSVPLFVRLNNFVPNSFSNDEMARLNPGLLICSASAAFCRERYCESISTYSICSNVMLYPL